MHAHKNDTCLQLTSKLVSSAADELGRTTEVDNTVPIYANTLEQQLLPRSFAFD